MFLEESYWMKQRLQYIMSDIETVVDIGASTLKFRTTKQPYIEENIFKPLRDRNVKIICLDLKKDEGIDISCNISDKLLHFHQKFDLVICANILEHVECLENSIINISNLVNDNHYLIVTVPYICPYHPDPIDNMSRYNIGDLKKLFKNFDVIFAESINIESRTYFDRFITGIRSIVYNIKDMKFIYLNDNIGYVIKKPIVTCVLFKKMPEKIIRNIK